MSDYESVNKIKRLKQSIETVTGGSYGDLTTAVQALKNGYGSSGGGIIDVTELPTSGIDENAVYRVTKSHKLSSELWYVEGYGDAVVMLEDWYEDGSKIETHHVEELPVDMKGSDLRNKLICVYITKDGIGHLYVPEYEYYYGVGVFTLGLLLMGDDSLNKGYTDNPYEETEPGIYITRETNNTIERLFVNINGDWQEITTYIETILANRETRYDKLSGTCRVGDSVELTYTGEGFDVAAMLIDERTIPKKIIAKTPSFEQYFTRNVSKVTLDWFRFEDGNFYVWTIPDYAFYCHYELEFIEMPDSIEWIGEYAFCACNELRQVELPNNVVSIGCFAFANSGLEKIELPEGLYYLEDRAFNACSNLTTVTFEGTPESMAPDVFTDCYELATINVPWSSDHPLNEYAPWGAPNATINWNCTEG